MAKTSPPSVSDKNTKTEILDAYKTLLGQLEAKPEEAGPVVQAQKTIVEQAEKETIEKIVGDLSQLKLSTGQAIATLTEKLSEEAERLAMLRKAVAISQQELDDTQQVKVTADQLYALIELQKQQEVTFTKEMEAKRTAWHEEQKAYEDKLKKDRAREEEEYAYAQKLLRQRHQQEWEELKRSQDKQRQEFEAEFGNVGEELERLRQTVSSFPAEKDKETQAAVAKAVAEAKKDADTQAAFAKHEADSKLKLAEAKIASLEEKVASQAQESKELKRQAEDAVRNVKEIAVSFVEGARKENGLAGKQPLADNQR